MPKNIGMCQQEPLYRTTTQVYSTKIALYHTITFIEKHVSANTGHFQYTSKKGLLAFFSNVRLYINYPGKI